MLPHLHRHKLQYPIDARANMQRIQLALFQLIERFLLIDSCLLGGQPRLCGIGGDFRPFAFQFGADRQLLFFHSGQIPDVVRPDALFE